MKKIILICTILLTFTFQSIGQINPIQNLSWSHWYNDPYNFFTLEWDEPESPHDDIIGYNIYREDDLFMFIDETSIYHIDSDLYGIISNCGGESFLMYDDGEGFFVHVTAVYNPGDVESTYTETVFVEGPLLSLNNFETQKPIIYPNPSKGIITIENENVDKIFVYDITGKKIREFDFKPQVDLSGVTKGIYIIKLLFDNEALVSKLILE